MKLENKYVPFIFFGLIISFFVIRNFIHEKKLNEAPRYTIGKVSDVSSTVDGGPMAEYTFQVNGKTYSGIFSLPSRDRREPGPKMMANDKFLVKFVSDNPSISYPLTEIKFNDTATAPYNGWTKMPED